MRKVYVVVADYDFDGYGEPEGCFGDKESAESFAAMQAQKYMYRREVLELIVQKKS